MRLAEASYCGKGREEAAARYVGRGPCSLEQAFFMLVTNGTYKVPLSDLQTIWSGTVLVRGQLADVFHGRFMDMGDTNYAVHQQNIGYYANQTDAHM